MGQLMGGTTAGFLRRPRQRSALQQQRHQPTKKATMKNKRALSSPAIIGNTARMMGTAPHRPTQLINTRSLELKPLKRQQAGKHRQRAGNENRIRIDSSSAGWRSAAAGRRASPAGRFQERSDLRQPRQAVSSWIPCRLRIGRLPSRKPRDRQQDTAAVEGVVTAKS